MNSESKPKPKTPPKIIWREVHPQYCGYADYRLIRDKPLPSKTAYELAKRLRRKYGWLVRVEEFKDGFYLYINSEKRK